MSSEIAGAEGLSHAELVAELERGGRLIRFSYAVSLCVISWGSDSRPHLVRAGEGTFFKALPYTLWTLLLGWWAIPFGPIFTFAALAANFTGGKDITHQVLRPPDAPPPPDAPSWKAFKEDKEAG